MSAAEDFNILGQFIKWVGLEGDEAEKFASEIMRRRGHKPATHWIDGDGKPNAEPDNIFGLTSKKASGGPGWQYGNG
jgi:hypothetical protein